MALFDMKKLKSTVQGAAATAALAVRDVADAAATAAEEGKLPDVKLPAIKLPTRVTNIVNGTANGPEASYSSVRSLNGRDALSAFYYLMSADGKLVDAERERFSELCAEFGEAYVAQAESIVADCNAQLDAHASSIPLVSVMTCVDGILYSASPQSPAVEDKSGDATSANSLAIGPKQLVWNMLVVGYSDDSFDDAEREVVMHVAKHYEVDSVVVQELELAVMTLGDLEREERWVKTTERSYLEIEALVGEIGKRKAAVLDGVQNLITL